MKSILVLIVGGALVACSGAAFTSLDGPIDASTSDAAAAGDASGEVQSPGDGGADELAPDAGDVDAGADAIATDGGRGDGAMCCAWMDAGLHFTACGAGEWGCKGDTGVNNCAGRACGAGATCILNDNSHGFTTWGEVAPCP